MNLAYLVQQYPPEVGAGPARVHELATRWLAAGAGVTVITGMPNRPEGRIHPAYRRKLFVEEECEGIRVLRSWLYASPKHGFVRTVANNTSFMVTGAVNALLRMGRPDVLIASSPPFFPHIAGDMVAAVRRVPLVLEIRDLWPDYLVEMGVLRTDGLPARALFRLERHLLMRAQLTVVVTESFKRRVIGKGVPAERVAVVPNGVDVRGYRPEREAAPIPALKRSEGTFVAGYLGNFGAGQSLETVIEAARLLAESDRSIRFVLAGDGPQRRQLTERAAELDLPNLSIHPPIPKGQTRAFYNACDVCLVPLAPLPILRETVPSKLFEIMACERPVVASVAGEAASIVRESHCGVTATPGDASALAAAIMRVAAQSADRRAEYGRNGRLFAARNYNRDTLADRYLALLESLRREQS